MFTLVFCNIGTNNKGDEPNIDPAHDRDNNVWEREDMEGVEGTHKQINGENCEDYTELISGFFCETGDEVADSVVEFW